MPLASDIVRSSVLPGVVLERSTTQAGHSAIALPGELNPYTLRASDSYILFFYSA